MRRTLNGAAAFKRTSSPCLDLFAVIGAARQHPAQVVQMFERAYTAEPALALRVALWARDARGGAGERTTFRNILHFLERRYPEAISQLVASGIVQQLGRWDDLFGLQGDAVWPHVCEQIRRGLLSMDRLLAKWLPRKGPLAARLRARFDFTEKQWRSVLSQLSSTVEQKMCARHWDEINFSQVPSVAAARYQATFRRQDEYRYSDYLNEVSAGRASMHAGAVFPHDVLKASRVDDIAATAQWSQLPRPALAGDVLTLCDVSDSMTRRVAGQTTAMDICLALGLLLSESMEGPFRNQVLTFTDQPAWHTVSGATLGEREASLRSARWGGTTNIQRAFDAILARARAAGPDFVMPKVLLVLSDMEFDVANDSRKLNHAMMQRKFAAAGFAVPTLVYWNLNGRLGNLPAGNQPGVVMVSGYSPKVADVLLAGNLDALTPEQVMRHALCVPRYDVPGLTV
jgi:hypothetical protein